MVKNIFHSINIVLALLMGLGPFWLFPICSELNPMGYPMKCYYSGWLAVGSAVAIVLLSVLAMFIKKKGMSYLSYLIALALGIFDIMAIKGIIQIGSMKMKHWEIGLCASAEHPCVENFGQAIPIILGILIAVNVVALIVLFVKGEQPRTR